MPIIKRGEEMISFSNEKVCPKFLMHCILKGFADSFKYFYGPHRNVMIFIDGQGEVIIKEHAGLHSFD